MKKTFGVNMVIALFRCQLDINKVQLYVNEGLTLIPGCATDLATDTYLFSEFAAIVQPFIQMCDLKAIWENQYPA